MDATTRAQIETFADRIVLLHLLSEFLLSKENPKVTARAFEDCCSQSCSKFTINGVDPAFQAMLREGMQARCSQMIADAMNPQR